MAALNKNNSAVKRIMAEARELQNDPSTDYTAAPLEDDIFEWHCTIRGPPGTEFEGGIYHFRILLPAQYPFNAPSIIFLTPNGRFELNSKICISFTNFHEELWQPAWGVRTAIIGLQGFFSQPAVGLGSIEYPASERRRLAAASRDWVCPHCQQSNSDILPEPASPSPGTEESPDGTSTVSTPSEEPVNAIPEVSLEGEPVDEAQAAAITVEEQPPNSAPPILNALPAVAAVVLPRVATRSTPIWLDSLIGLLLALVVAILLRRL